MIVPVLESQLCKITFYVSLGYEENLTMVQSYCASLRERDGQGVEKSQWWLEEVRWGSSTLSLNTYNSGLSLHIHSVDTWTRGVRTNWGNLNVCRGMMGWSRNQVRHTAWSGARWSKNWQTTRKEPNSDTQPPKSYSQINKEVSSQSLRSQWVNHSEPRRPNKQMNTTPAGLLSDAWPATLTHPWVAGQCPKKPDRQTYR